MSPAPGAPLDPLASPDAAGDVRPGLLLFESGAALHVEPDALADALAELKVATDRLDALYAAEDASDGALFAYNPDQPRGSDGKWGGGGGDTRVASAGTKDGLGTSRAAKTAREGSTSAQAATVAAKSGGSHADAAKAHTDAAAQHREAAARSVRADYKAAHEMAAAAHEKVAEKHKAAGGIAEAGAASSKAWAASVAGHADAGKLHQQAADLHAAQAAAAPRNYDAREHAEQAAIHQNIANRAKAGKVAAERDTAPIALDAATRETRYASAVLLDAEPAKAGATTDPTAPRWIQVAAEGKYAKNGQEFTLDRPVFEQIVRNIRARASFHKGPDGIGDRDVVPFDWRHASEMAPTIPGAFASQQALGWALDLDCRMVGGKAQLWAFARFMPDAAEAIAAGRVKWTSVAVWPNATDPHGKPIGWDLSSIALTNDPHIQGMVPIGATRFGRGDEISAAPAAHTNPAVNREIRKMDETLKALLIALGKHFNCAGTPEGVQHYLDHQAPIVLQRMTALEKSAADEPGRLAQMKKLLEAADGDGSGANAKDFDDAFKKIHARMTAQKVACEKAAAENAQLAKDRDGLMAELEAKYGGEVKDEEDRVGKDVKATLDRHGIDPAKDEAARIAATGLLFERTGGVALSAKATVEQMKGFLASRQASAAAYAEKYPAPEVAPGQVSPSMAPQLYNRYFGSPDGNGPRPAAPLTFGRAPAQPIALGNQQRPLTDGPQPEQGGLDLPRFMASAGRNATEKAVAYVRGMDPANAKLEPRVLFDLARPIVEQAKRLAAAQGIDL